MKLKTPVIKDYFCIDIENIDEWNPEDPEFVDFWLDIYVGFEESEGSDNFGLHVVTQRQLSQVINKKYLLIIPYYEGIKQILEEIETTLEKCKDINWLGASNQIEKLYFWEYHDFKPAY